MIFYKYPEWSVVIRNHYWILRSLRPHHVARRRMQYRRIEVEKKRLQSEGVDAEVVRLLCRHMVNLRNVYAEKRFWQAFHKSKQLQLSFFD